VALSKLNNDSFGDTAVHGRRNLVINGAMQVAQRGDVTGVTAGNVYGGADRFATSGSSFGTVSLVQEADAPEGFAESQRVKFTTARSTTATSDHFIIGTRLEGQDLQRFKKGTSNAESMTVSFYAKASQATTIQAELYDGDNNRHASKEFAITTSWARYSYSFAGDTTGAFDNDNGLSLYVLFWLGAGTDFTSGTNPNGSWLALDQTRRVHSDVGTTFMDTLNAEFNLTGVQLEVGDKATPFEHRSFGEEQALCQRYYQEVGHFRHLTIGSRWSSNQIFATYNLASVMRATPTATATGVPNTSRYDNGQSADASSLNTVGGVEENTTKGANITLIWNAGYDPTAALHYVYSNTNGDKVALDAEL